MIGIFDSGFGGLAIFKEIIKLLPDYNYIYLGDSARLPYGNRSQETIYEFTKEAVDFLFKQGCELIIIACGTASAESLRKIQQEYLPRTNFKLINSKLVRGKPKNYPQHRVLGIIRPLAEEAVRISRFGRIGVAGTKSTIASGAYRRELEKLKTQNSKLKILEIFQQACPLLVPLIEEGWIKKPETKMILKKYLRPLKEKKVDTLILGCTHYPLLYQEFSRIMGKRCRVLKSGEIVAKSLQDYLRRHPEIESKINQNRQRTFYTTDDPVSFAELGSKFFGEKFEAEKIVL
jgi:glutamate racemase